jgi:MFS family permease
MGGIAFASLYSTLGVPIAWLADRFSRVWIMTVALTVWSGFTAACGLAQNFSQLFLARMGVGVGEAGGVAPAYSLISDYFPKESRARALAAYSFGIPIGSAAGILFGGLLAAAIDWRAAFVVVGLSGVLLAPLFRMTVKDPVRGRYDRPAEASPIPGAKPKAPGIGRVGATVLPKPSFWLLAFGAAASSTCGYGIAFWLPSFFARSYGLDLVDRSLFMSALALFGGVAGIWLGGALGDRFGGRAKGAYATVPAICFLIALPFFFAGVNVPNAMVDIAGYAVPGLAVAFALFLVPQGLNLAWLGPVVTAVQHLAPSSMRSTASAMFLLINNLVGIGLGTWYFGAVSDLLRPRFGDESLRWAIYSGLGFYLLAAILLLAASRTLKRDWVD